MPVAVLSSLLRMMRCLARAGTSLLSYHMQDMRLIGAANVLDLGVGCPLVLGSGRSARTFSHEDILRLREDVYVPWVAAGGNLVLAQLEVVRE